MSRAPSVLDISLAVSFVASADSLDFFAKIVHVCAIFALAMRSVKDSDVASVELAGDELPEDCSLISFEIYQELEKCLPELVNGGMGGELELVKKGGVAA